MFIGHSTQTQTQTSQLLQKRSRIMDFKCTVWITLQNYLNNYNLEIQRPMYIDIKHFWKKQNKTLFKLSRGQAHDRVNAIAFILALGSWPSENLDDATCNLAFWLFFFTLQLLQLFWRMQGCFAVKFQKMFFFGWRKLQPTFHKCRGRVIFVQTCALMSISISFFSFESLASTSSFHLSAGSSLDFPSSFCMPCTYNVFSFSSMSF